MPYKNIKDQRAYERKWRKENYSEKIKVKNTARKIAQKAFPNPKRCSVEGCKKEGERHHLDYSKPLEIVWLCHKHHVAIHKQEPKTCSIEGCNRPHVAKGMCHPCYKKERRALGYGRNTA